VSQTLVKNENNKPFTEYVIDLKKDKHTWTIHRKFKEICDLNSALKTVLPGVSLSEVSYIVCPQEATKKSLVI